MMHRFNRPVYPRWQMAFTDEALRRAWLKVRANNGTSGPDGQTVADFERDLDAQLRSLQQELIEGRYKPRRVTQVLVPKASSGWRPLSLWAIRDRVVQRAVYNYLEPVVEPRFLACSYGFRPGRTTKDAALAIHQARLGGADWVFDGDIKDCFGQMKREILQKQLGRWGVPGPLRELIDRWLRAHVWNAWRGDGQAGTSQGGAISPLLCNIYLHEFDEQLRHRRWRLIRYADDFVIVGRSQREAERAGRRAGDILAKLGLEIHPQKSRITSFAEGFQFVGWFFINEQIHELR